MGAAWKYLGRVFAFALVATALAGCKVDLNTNLSEQEANQIIAILLENGIEADKVIAKEGVSVQIDKKDMLAAINMLKQSGYPKKERESLGSVFQKTGIMSSPFEERARFIYALSQELSQTLNEIDGVYTARVHIVLPDDPDLGERIVPSSAAVFIKHRAGLDLDFFIPQIKRLVSNAIEGVSYDKVSVVLIEAEKMNRAQSAPAKVETSSLAGFVVDFDKITLSITAAVAIAMVLILVALNVFFAAAFFRSRRNSRPIASVPPEIEPA